MSFDPSEGTSDGRVKRKAIGFEVEIKQEPNIKDEQLDEIELNYLHSQTTADEQDEPDQMIKSESETDTEFTYDIDLDAVDMKEESKLKTEKDTKPQSMPGRATNGNDDDGKSNRRQRKVKSIGKRKNRDGSQEQKKRTIPKKKQKMHKCQLCQYQSPLTHNLMRHMRTHTEERPFQCDVCLKNFIRNNNLNQHMKIHASLYQFKCANCGWGFFQESQLIKHAKECERKRRYECYLCEYRTQYKNNMIKHMSIHSERPFECLVCLKSFTQKTGLTQHLQIHQNELQFGCSKCGHRFAEKDEIGSHEKRCKQRRFGCYLCRYESFYKCDLNRHMRAKHTGVKQFLCEICGMKFGEGIILNRHLATHREQFPYKCAKCHREFSEEAKRIAHDELCPSRQHQCYLCSTFQHRITILRAHMHACHTGEKPFGCQICGAHFTNKIHLNQHIKRVHHANMEFQ